LKFLRFAAIDIGSNAVRLLIENVIETEEKPVFKKLSLIRVPIRLGDSSFLEGNIKKELIPKLIDTIKAFKILMEVHEVVAFRACATAAMREAANSAQIVQEIGDATDIWVEVIDGREEAEILFANNIAELIDPGSSCLYVDVGGGSTEISLFSDNELKEARSFSLGTVRIIKKGRDPEEWEDLGKWLEKVNASYQPDFLIGTGGNINKIGKMLHIEEGSLEAIHKEKIEELYQYIKSYTEEERIIKLDMAPDRADVIIPATEIFLEILNRTNSDRIYAPKIGLSDGIVKQLYEQNKLVRTGA